MHYELIQWIINMQPTCCFFCSRGRKEKTVVCLSLSLAALVNISFADSSLTVQGHVIGWSARVWWQDTHDKSHEKKTVHLPKMSLRNNGAPPQSISFLDGWWVGLRCGSRSGRTRALWQMWLQLTVLGGDGEMIKIIMVNIQFYWIREIIFPLNSHYSHSDLMCLNTCKLSSKEAGSKSSENNESPPVSGYLSIHWKNDPPSTPNANSSRHTMSPPENTNLWS